MDLELKGKGAIVTGGSLGIGAAVAVVAAVGIAGVMSQRGGDGTNGEPAGAASGSAAVADAASERSRIVVLPFENLGAAETLVTHPATMTHADVPAAGRRAAGISDGLVRLSVGLEDPEDLMEDLDQALRQVDGNSQ